MRLIILISFLIFTCILFSSVNAMVYYNITVKGKDAIINTTFTLEAQQKIAIWQVSWNLPENSKVLSLRDDKGKITDYILQKDVLIFETNSYISKSRTVYLSLLVENAVKDTFKPLYNLELSLPGIPDKETIVDIHIPHIISGDSSFGFTEYFTDNFAQFVGKGPINFNIFYSFSGKKYKHYVLFGDYDIQAADDLFDIIPSITGINVPFQRFPIIILPDTNFEKNIKAWGSGTHLRGGLIIIKESAMESPNNVSIILHETTHGFNAKALKWSKVNITWFDEGTATFVEYLINKKLNVKQGELFGEDTSFIKDNRKYILHSRGDKDELWEYYKENKNFMKEWNPETEETRDFGYAFSELIARDFILKNGIESLKDVYEKLSKINHTINSSEEYNSIILYAMKYNFRPCYSLDRNQFDLCLKMINEQKIELPIFMEETTTTSATIIIPIFNETETEEPIDTFENFLLKIGLLLKLLFDNLKQIFR